MATHIVTVGLDNTLAETSGYRLTLTKKAHPVMSRHPVSLKENTSISDAINLFDNKIPFIPIVDNNNMLVGAISWRDILKRVDAKQLIE